MWYHYLFMIFHDISSRSPINWRWLRTRANIQYTNSCHADLWQSSGFNVDIELINWVAQETRLLLHHHHSSVSPVFECVANQSLVSCHRMQMYKVYNMLLTSIVQLLRATARSGRYINLKWKTLNRVKEDVYLFSNVLYYTFSNIVANFLL